MLRAQKIQPLPAAAIPHPDPAVVAPEEVYIQDLAMRPNLPVLVLMQRIRHIRAVHQPLRRQRLPIPVAPCGIDAPVLQRADALIDVPLSVQIRRRRAGRRHLHHKIRRLAPLPDAVAIVRRRHLRIRPERHIAIRRDPRIRIVYIVQDKRRPRNQHILRIVGIPQPQHASYVFHYRVLLHAVSWPLRVFHKIVPMRRGNLRFRLLRRRPRSHCHSQTSRKHPPA